MSFNHHRSPRHEDVRFGLTDRRAQQGALSVIRRRFDEERPRILLDLCIAAGKTNVASDACCTAIAEARAEFVIIVVPSVGTASQWVSDARAFDLNLSADEDLDSLARHGVPPALNGISMTFAAVQLKRDRLNQIVQAFGGEVIVVIDEIHHAGLSHDDFTPQSWGDTAQIAFSGAWCIIGMTGTPWRHDQNLVPWMRHGLTDAGPIMEPDFRYTFAEARRDGVVPPVFAHWVGGTFSVFDVETGTPLTVTTFDHDFEWMRAADRKEAERTRLGSAISPHNPIALQVLADCGEYLLRVRRGHGDRPAHPDAGGAIICRDGTQLREVVRTLREMGFNVAFTTAAEASHDDVIDRFNADTSIDFIVSIKQLSEGVTMKRLRVLGYLSNVTTLLFIVQVIGRLARLAPGMTADEQPVRFIAPADRRFIRAVEQIEEPDPENVERRPLPMTETCDACGMIYPESLGDCPRCNAPPPLTLPCPNPDCGAEVPLGARSCHACGTAIDAEPAPDGSDDDIDVPPVPDPPPPSMIVCANCGAEYSADQPECPECGAETPPPPDVVAPPGPDGVLRGEGELFGSTLGGTTLTVEEGERYFAQAMSIVRETGDQAMEESLRSMDSVSRHHAARLLVDMVGRYRDRSGDAA